MTRLAMTSRPIWLATALALSLGAGPAAAGVEPAKTKPATVLTEQSRALVTARVGVPVEIRLGAQTGTGYSWVPARQVPGLKAIKAVRSSRPMAGSPQVQRFRFTPQRKWTYRLVFSYGQPWNGGTKNARTKGFVIVAR